MTNEIIKNLKTELEKHFEFFKNEAAKIRTGRASAAIVEDIEIDCYGAKMPVKQLAAISVPEPRQIVVEPWDKSNLDAIQKGIAKSDIGINPIVEKNLIRLVIPPLTEERRKDLAKVLKEKIEQAKVAARRERDEARKKIASLEKEKKISQDEKFRGEEEVQKTIDDFNKKIDEAGKKKEEEIMKI